MADQNLNLKQIYDANPSTIVANKDLIYLDKFPYNAGDDSAIEYEDLIAQILAAVPQDFIAANTYYVDPAGDNANDGSQNAPYADPYFASDSVTGTITDIKAISINNGDYNILTATIKPNVTYAGCGYGTHLDVGTTTLHSSWSSATTGAITPIQNLKWDGSLNIDFNAAGFNGAGGIMFDRCYIETLNVTGPGTISMFGGVVGVVTIASASGTFISAQVADDITITASASVSGGKSSKFIGCEFNSATDITISGASGKTQELIIKSSPIRGTLTIDGTFVTLRIDATSIPQGGITFINGADASQVNLIGNAPAKSLNNAYTGQNYVPPVSISSSGGVLTWDLNLAPFAKCTLTENITSVSISNAIEGATYKLLLTQDAVTPRTVIFGSSFRWQYNNTPMMSQGLGSKMMVNVTYDGSHLVEDGLSQALG